MPDTTNYNALAGGLLSRGRTPAGSTPAGGATVTQDASVGGSDWITVEGSLGPAAGAAGDLTCLVYPYAADGNTIYSTPLVPAAGYGYAGTLSGGLSQLAQKYDVSGIDQVRIVWKNNNAGALPLAASWREESW
jgi:hypothetical protein